MYVALSRITRIDNLSLIGKYNPNVLKVHENTIIEYSRLQQNRFCKSSTDYVDWNSLTLSLLNARSLKRHNADNNRARQLADMIYAWKSNYEWYWCDRHLRAVKYFQDLFLFLCCKTSKPCLLSSSKYCFLKRLYISRHICYWYYKREFFTWYNEDYAVISLPKLISRDVL